MCTHWAGNVQDTITTKPNISVPGQITEASLRDGQVCPPELVGQSSTLLSLPLHWRPRRRFGSCDSVYQFETASAPGDQQIETEYSVIHF